MCAVVCIFLQNAMKLLPILFFFPREFQRTSVGLTKFQDEFIDMYKQVGRRFVETAFCDRDSGGGWDDADYNLYEPSCKIKLFLPP